MQKIILFVLVLFFVQCSGNQLIVDPAISEAENLKTVALASIHHPAQVDGVYPDVMEDDGSRRFHNDLDVEIHLTKAMVHWDFFELVSGGDDEECLDDLNERFSIDVTENILDDDFSETFLAERSDIPNLAYCQFSAVISSVEMAGTWSRESASGSFDIDLMEPISVLTHFHTVEEGEVFEHPLHFSDDEDTASVILSQAYDQWFDGLSFTESNEEFVATLKENIESNLNQHLEEHHLSESSESDSGHDEEEHDHSEGESHT